MKTLVDLVSIYYRNYAKTEDYQLSDFKNKSKPIEELIKDAVYGLNPYLKRDRHQFRIPKEILEEMTKRLQETANIQEILRSKCFDDIFTIVYETKIKKFGPLAVYDTSLRISAIFGFYPTVVYLHQGALTGAMTLLGKVEFEKYSKYYCGDENYPYITADILPKPLSEMEPYHIENFLCINKDKFNHVEKISGLSKK